MNPKIVISFFLTLALPITVQAEVGRIVEPLPCGIYDQQARPFIIKDIETQNADPLRYTMEMTTMSGKRLRVEVQNVSIRMAGERNHVSVFVDGKPHAKTSHQDLPLYLEVHLDNVKYRIICVRNDPEPKEDAAANNGTAATPPPAR